MKAIMLTVFSLSLIPSLYALSVSESQNVERFRNRAAVQTFECTTDLDCECKVVPYEEPNNSIKCMEYRGEPVKVSVK